MIIIFCISKVRGDYIGTTLFGLAYIAIKLCQLSCHFPSFYFLSWASFSAVAAEAEIHVKRRKISNDLNYVLLQVVDI